MTKMCQIVNAWLMYSSNSYKKKYPGIIVEYVCKPNNGFYQDMLDGRIDIMFAHDMEFKKYNNLNYNDYEKTHCSR